MILAFVEDGTTRIHRSRDDAVIEYEGVDVEAGVVTFYAEDGTWLEPVFTQPNRSGCLLGPFSWVESGTYHLEPGDGSGEDPLWVALLEHPTLEPDPAIGIRSMDELKRHLRACGAEVDDPSGDDPGPPGVGGTPPPSGQ